MCSSINIKKKILNIIIILHTFFILFIVLAPVTNINYYLTLHSATIPFLILHWIFNNNICILTTIEKNLRKKIYGKNYKYQDCFTCKIIDPVFNFQKNNISSSKFIYIITICLWCISISKLFYKYRINKIQHYSQLLQLYS